MKTGWIRALPLLMVVGAAAIAGCGSSSSSGSSGGGATVEMNQTNFAQHSITVQAGKPVHFDDTAGGGGVHVLCVGTGNGGDGNTCYQAAKAPPNTPSELIGSGTTFNVSDKKDITFPAAGTYHVICTIHQGMYIDITVS